MSTITHNLTLAKLLAHSTTPAEVQQILDMHEILKDAPLHHPSLQTFLNYLNSKFCVRLGVQDWHRDYGRFTAIPMYRYCLWALDELLWADGVKEIWDGKNLLAEYVAGLSPTVAFIHRTDSLVPIYPVNLPAGTPN